MEQLIATTNRYHAYVFDARGTEQHISFATYEQYLRFESDYRADFGEAPHRFVVDAPPYNAAGLNWPEIGKNLRTSADDAHDGNTPDVRIAYSFLLDNPECFLADGEDWPADMPQEPTIELIAAYYKAYGAA